MKDLKSVLQDFDGNKNKYQCSDCAFVARNPGITAEVDKCEGQIEKEVGRDEREAKKWSWPRRAGGKL